MALHRHHPRRARPGAARLRPAMVKKTDKQRTREIGEGFFRSVIPPEALQ
jgi:hypothetical protein